MDDTTFRGAVAGVVGVWVMDIVTWIMYRKESRELIEQEKRTRIYGKDTAHATARKLARSVRSDAAKEELNAGGIFIHYMLGIIPAMAYARLRKRYPALKAGNGALWGATLFVANDEIGGRVLGLVGPQRDYPWQTHVRGLVGHVVLGVATDVVLDALEDASPSEAGRGRELVDEG